MTRSEVQRYKSRPEQQRATKDDCRNRYQVLFGKPWDQKSLNDWLEWLGQHAPADAKAREVLANLVDALDAAHQYFAEQSVPPIEQREHREGLRVELVSDGSATAYRLFVDPKTLPPEAPEGLRTMTEPFPGLAPIPATTLLAAGCDATVDWQPSGPLSTLPRPITLRYRLEPPQGGSFALFLRMLVQSALEHFSAHMDRVLPLFDIRKRPPTWEDDGALARLAVLAFFDRSYGPGELIGRRDSRAPANQLTNGELATISILCGNWPGMPADELGLTVADIVDREARHMPTARKTLIELRAAGFPVPRTFSSTGHIDLTGDPPGDGASA